VLVRLVELPHAEEVAGRETTQARLGLGQVRRELGNDAVAPLCRRDLATDDGPDLPVQLDELAVHRLDRALARRGDQRNHFFEGSFGECVLAHVVRSSLFPFLPQPAAELGRRGKRVVRGDEDRLRSFRVRGLEDTW
jgi:hypothetical protein